MVGLKWWGCKNAQAAPPSSDAIRRPFHYAFDSVSFSHSYYTRTLYQNPTHPTAAVNPPTTRHKATVKLAQRHQRPPATKQPNHQRIQRSAVCGNDVQEYATVSGHMEKVRSMKSERQRRLQLALKFPQCRTAKRLDSQFVLIQSSPHSLLNIIPKSQLR